MHKADLGSNSELKLSTSQSFTKFNHIISKFPRSSSSRIYFFILFWCHTQQCSGHAPSSALRRHLTVDLRHILKQFSIVYLWKAWCFFYHLKTLQLMTWVELMPDTYRALFESHHCMPPHSRKRAGESLSLTGCGPY